MCLSWDVGPAADILDSSTHQQEQQPTFAPQRPLPVPRAMAPTDSKKSGASRASRSLVEPTPADASKTTATARKFQPKESFEEKSGRSLSGIGKKETPAATSSPTEHITILGTRYQVVHLWGNRNCSFYNASKAIHNNNSAGHM